MTDEGPMHWCKLLDDLMGEITDICLSHDLKVEGYLADMENCIEIMKTKLKDQVYADNNK